MIPISAFGLLKDGSISISLENFSLRPDVKLDSNDIVSSAWSNRAAWMFTEFFGGSRSVSPSSAP